MTPIGPGLDQGAQPARAEPVRVSGRPGWDQHPAVRTGRRLRRGERAADRVLRVAGSWQFLTVTTVVVVAGLRLGWTTGVSVLALVEVSLMLVALRRADRIAVELALHHLDQARRAAAVAEDLREQMTQLHAEIARVAAITERAGHAPYRA
jgi:hypothetical protein